MSFKKVYGSNELFEVVDIKALKYIVKNWKKYEGLIVKPNDNDYDYDPKKLCDKYIKNYKKYISVSYQKSSKYPSKTGRWFCKNGIGIQSLPRIIRHTICDGYYIDLDFKNAHPVILEQLCKKHDIPCNNLSTYIRDRDELLTEWSERINLPKDKVKEIYLCALNGNKMRYDIPYWFEILEEFKTIHKSIACLPVYEIILKEVEEKERDNVFAKVVNRVLCTLENECLSSLFDCLNKRNAFQVDIDGVYHKVCSLIFDGLQLPFNADNDAYCNPDNFKNMSYYIKTNTGYDLEICRKPFDTKLIIPDDEEEEDDKNGGREIHNDADAGEHIFKKYKKYMKNVSSVKYVKFNDVWTSNDNVVKSVIASWINETSMIITTKNGEISYNRIQSHISKCTTWIMSNWLSYIPDNPTFIDDINRNSRGYIPFKDFIYDTKNKRTFRYDECDIQFTEKISKNMPIRCLIASQLLMEKIIEPSFPNEEERKYYFYRLARALAGHIEDKIWILNKGSRNCGKGVFAKLLKSGFDALVGAFNAGCFTKKKFENNDDAKALSWVVGVRNKRLIISNEIDENTMINGIMLKKLANGGNDTIVGRTNNKDEMEFIPQFTLMFNCNNIKGIDPVDAYKTCEQFIWKRQFVNKEELIKGQDFLREKDINIDAFISRDDIIDAFSWLILDAYADYMPVPDCVLYSNEELIEDVPITLETLVVRHFKKTDNADDKLFTTDIITNIQRDCNFADVSNQALSTLLIKIGVNRATNGNISVNKKKAKGYMNIKYIPPTAVEKEEYNK